MCSAVTWHEHHGDKEALRTGKVWEARVAAWRGSHTLKKEKHARLVLGAARCPRLMYLLDQQRAGLDATDGCVDRERGRSVDPITCIVHIDLAVYETEYTQSKAAAAARRRRPATSLSQRCPSQERIEHLAYFARFDAYFVRFGAYIGLLRLFRYNHAPVAQSSVKDITLIHNSSKNTEKTAYC